jgi:hypothetical protein
VKVDIPNPEAVSPRARVIAFYLPQFHTTPENDEWWGKGFTEWTNVKRARPLYRSHKQPVIPGELGYYDLTSAETRAAQAQLAKAYGVSGFCYWHYWFQGRRLLNRPFDEVLASGEPDFPFCLGWANVAWTAEWAGASNRVLIAQEYSAKDWDEHLAFLFQAFSDARYIRVDGKPLFYIHQPATIPDPARTADLIREGAEKAGVGQVFLVGNNIGDHERAVWGFDAFTRHFPAWNPLASIKAGMPQWVPDGVVERVEAWDKARRKRLNRPRRRSYRKWVVNDRGGILPGSVHQIPLAVSNWDNTPRVGWRGLVLTGATPAAFRRHLDRVLHSIESRPASQRLVFLKSWNEWAEGNYVEPDRTTGRARLEVLRDEVFRLNV